MRPGEGAATRDTEEALAGLALQERCRLAESGALTREEQADLVRDPAVEVREALAKNASVLEEVASVLAHDPMARVRQVLTRRARLGASAQRVLAGDVDQWVRLGLAWSRGLVPDVLDSLASDPVREVRSTLAARPAAAEPELALRLARDEDARVHHALINNWHVALSAEFPLDCLEVCERGRRFVDEFLEPLDLDPEALGVLRSRWCGTLTELVETTKELAAGTGR
jgi:hypothetical protein